MLYEIVVVRMIYTQVLAAVLGHLLCRVALVARQFALHFSLTLTACTQSLVYKVCWQHAKLHMASITCR